MKGKLLAPTIGLALVLTACGGSDDPEPTAQLTAAVSTPDTDQESASVPEPDGPHGSGCTPSSETSLPDGRWFGFAAETTDTSVAFDLACWFTGDARLAAAEEDGAPEPLTDHYIRNNNELTRELPVADGATATFYLSGDPLSREQGDFAAWRDVVVQRGDLFGVWVETSGGEIVTVEEQWTP